MNKDDWHKIKNIEICKDYHLKLTFNDNSEFIFDMNNYFQPGSAFMLLKDSKIFENVKIADDGRSIIFPNDLDFCADSLWLKAHPESISPY